MKDVSDILTVYFDSGVKDESALCVTRKTRKYGEKIIMLKMELGEQADILYHLLTEQMTKAEIKAESETYQLYLILLGYLTEQNSSQFIKNILLQLYMRADSMENEVKENDT